MFDTRGVQITWLGQSAYRIRSAGKTFYLDPFLTPNPLCPEKEKHPKLADFILLTHGHADHTSDAISLAKASNAQVLCMIELGMWLIKNGVAAANVVQFNKGGTVTAGGAKVTMVHADHSSSIEQDGLALYLGEPAGFVIEFAEGLRAYFAGDTAVFGDMKLIGEIYRPDVAFLPIGGHFTMDPLEAAHACRLLGVSHVVPNHYGTWPVLKGTPEELRQHLRQLGVPCEVWEMQVGQTL
ncbi:MAG TPA: metal-dependent hydrolase [Terriglobales bacterium]|jgi:L-ascorbate metabolism protein UlaG (beta-lactamase superfamily)